MGDKVQTGRQGQAEDPRIQIARETLSDYQRMDAATVDEGSAFQMLGALGVTVELLLNVIDAQGVRPVDTPADDQAARIELLEAVRDMLEVKVDERKQWDRIEMIVSHVEAMQAQEIAILGAAVAEQAEQ